MFDQGRPNIIWLEDQEGTADLELAHVRGVAKVHLFPAPHAIKSVIEDEFTTLDRASLAPYRLGLIVDIMLVGIDDLKAIGIQDADTNGGATAGIVLIDRYLRASDSPFCDLPICVLTERELDPDLDAAIAAIRSRGGGAVVFARKYNEDGLRAVKEFVSSL